MSTTHTDANGRGGEIILSEMTFGHDDDGDDDA